MENDNILDLIWWRVRNEPVRVAEDFRRFIFTIPVILGITVDDAKLTAAVTLVGLILSWLANEKARNAVTPVVKMEEDLEFNTEFEELVENYG